MTDADLDEVTKQLSAASVGVEGVSFEGKSLSLDTAEDAKQVVEAINACKSLDYLNLEGNTLGVEAAKAIGKALESHSEFKRALWKDMFTGRMKTEIPKALQFLGSSLVLAGARLSELDLSDNAFGPIGVEGLAVLLRSQSCFNLHTLKLNNNGLGIDGGKMLSRALLDCYNSSKAAGKPLSLKVFIAGRNRLENEGAKALAEVFKTVGTLEEIAMPQNGIYHVGIAALSEAFTRNPNLRILNLNDNTVTPKGAQAVANALPSLQKLEEINFGDCLLRTKGAILLAKALSEGHKELQGLHLDSNDIGAKGGLELAKAMRNKNRLKNLILGGNLFGESGRRELQSELKDSGHLETLGSLSEDEDEENDDDEEEEDEESESEGESEEQESDKEEKPEEMQKEAPKDLDSTPKIKTEVLNGDLNISQKSELPSVTLAEFLQNPTAENFVGLGSKREELVIKEIQGYPEEEYLEKLMPILMQVSALTVSNSEPAKQAALSCSNALYRELFRWAENKDKSSLLNNSLLVHLGLIKSEKKIDTNWNLEGCMLALEQAIRKEYFPGGTRETLQLFLGRPNLKVDTFPKTKLKLMTALFQ